MKEEKRERAISPAWENIDHGHFKAVTKERGKEEWNEGSK